VQGWRRYFYYFPTSAAGSHELIRGATGRTIRRPVRAQITSAAGTDPRRFSFPTGGGELIIVLKPGSSEADIEDVSRRVGEMGIQDHLSRGRSAAPSWAWSARIVQRSSCSRCSRSTAWKTCAISSPSSSRAARRIRRDPLQVKGVPIGGKELVVNGGPCSVSPPQLMAVAEGVKGAAPRSSGRRPSKRAPRPTLPGLEEEDSSSSRRRARPRAPRCHRVMDPRRSMWSPGIPTFSRSRAQRAELLPPQAVASAAACALQTRHVDVDRGMAALRGIRLAGGNPNVILVERGIRTSRPRRATPSTQRPFRRQEALHLPFSWIRRTERGTGNTCRHGQGGTGRRRGRLIIEVHNNRGGALDAHSRSSRPFRRPHGRAPALAANLGRSL